MINGICELHSRDYKTFKVLLLFNIKNIELLSPMNWTEGVGEVSSRTNETDTCHIQSKFHIEIYS